MEEKAKSWLEKWKELLVAIAGLLVVVLQIINVIISADIDYSLGGKAADIARKTEALQRLITQNAQQSKNNSNALTEIDKQVTGIGEQLNSHIQSSRQFADLLKMNLKPNPTPSQ